MSSQLILEGKKYTPATLVGERFGYTKEYILLLIKQGKIDGKKIGHKWYAHIPSADHHFKTAARLREVRRKEISESRKAELHAHTKARKTATPKKHTARTILVEVLAVLILALSLGTAGYMSTSTPTQTAATTQADHGFFGSLALALYRFIAGEETTIVVTTTHTTPTMEEAAVSAHIGTTTHTSLIVAPDELFTATTVEAVQDSFSDPVSVSVDPENPNTGIITPEFKEGNGEEYRFLMVPVTEAHGS
jgi:hypothetical protein